MAWATKNARYNSIGCILALSLVERSSLTHQRPPPPQLSVATPRFEVITTNSLREVGLGPSLSSTLCQEQPMDCLVIYASGTCLRPRHAVLLGICHVTGNNKADTMWRIPQLPWSALHHRYTSRGSWSSSTRCSPRVFGDTSAQGTRRRKRARERLRRQNSHDDCNESTRGTYPPGTRTRARSQNGHARSTKRETRPRLSSICSLFGSVDPPRHVSCQI